MAPARHPSGPSISSWKKIVLPISWYWVRPAAPVPAKSRPVLAPGGKELNAEGMYLMPGFVDMHGHIGGAQQGVSAEYVFKLWMGHGITTVRDPGCMNGLDWVLEEKTKSQQNLITAPRLKAYTVFGQGSKTAISTPAQAIAWVDDNAKKGADGVKFFGAAPDIMKAALEENKRLGLRSACHHAQMDVARWNVLNSARAGLTSMEHWYGLPEALFADKTIQDYPLDASDMVSPAHPLPCAITSEIFTKRPGSIPCSAR